MLTAEHDPFTPAWNAETVLKSISDESLVTFRQIVNAGHFSFLSPFPESMKNPKFLPAKQFYIPLQTLIFNSFHIHRCISI